MRCHINRNSDMPLVIQGQPANPGSHGKWPLIRYVGRVCHGFYISICCDKSYRATFVSSISYSMSMYKQVGGGGCSTFCQYVQVPHASDTENFVKIHPAER